MSDDVRMLSDREIADGIRSLSKSYQQDIRREYSAEKHRRAMIYYEAGETLREVGHRFGVSRENIRQHIGRCLRSQFKTWREAREAHDRLMASHRSSRERRRE